MTEVSIDVMHRGYAKRVSLCLLVLVLTFAALVPGESVETRDFSHLSPTVF